MITKLKFFIVLLAICHAAIVKSQIILPIEVIGDAGLTKSVTVNVTDASKVTGLWMLVNNLSYENKASVKINNGAWIKLNNTTVNVPEPAKSYGGIGGGFYLGSMKITLPLATGAIVNGNNTISFKFEYSDGLSAGFRVVRFNLVDATGIKLLPSTTFKDDDPNTWVQPIAGTAAAAAGKVLWETKNITEGPQSSIVLKAKCGDCHAKNGRDLKYFNYSNESIIARSKFHKLSQLEAEQIASYIRSLNVPNPGRPWNPPYQPGPGIDSKPVNEWAAGAGIDWVLDKDEMAFPYIFPNGIDTSAISLTKTLNVRETPVMMQFPDWNHWLPTIHPYDASFGGDKFTNSAGNYLYNGEGTNTKYNYNLTALMEGGPNATLSSGALFRTKDGLHNTLSAWIGELENFIDPLIEAGLTTSNGLSPEPNWTKKFADEVYAYKLWSATKQWEILNGNNAEGMGKTLYGPKGEERTWPGIFRHVFNISPHLSKVPRVDSTSFNGKEINQIYTSNVWYHVQPVLSSGNVNGGGFSVVDWAYAHGNLNDLRKGGTNPNIAEPGRELILYVKQMQQKHQNFKGAGAEDPWFGWDILRDHNLSDLVFFDSDGLWNRTDPALARQIMDVLLQVWYTKSISYPASLYKTGNDGYDVTGYDAVIYDMIPSFRARGVNCDLLNKIADFGKTLPQSAVRNWDALKVSCSAVNYTKVSITSPLNNALSNGNSFTVQANATIASGSISKVEFFDGDVLIGTDNASPYSFIYTNMQLGSHSIMAKAYDQNGQNASVDTRTVVVNESSTTDTQAPTVPASLTSTNVTTTSFTLNWLASTDAVGVTGYEIFRGGTSIGTSATNSFNVTGLTANTAYSMTVRARDAAGNWSAQSTALSVTTSAVAGDTTPPTIPASLTSASVAQTSFTLNWSASTDAVGVTGYEVFRGGTSIGTPTATTFSVTGLIANTAYSMTVRARDAVGNWSAQSTALSVTTSAGTGATNIATSGVASTWNSIPSATSTSDVSKSANTAINDGNTTVEVVYTDVNNAGDWQAAGIVWAVAQPSITSIKYYNGLHINDGFDNGSFTANMKVQSTTNGTTWTDVSGWTISPSYPYTSAASNQTYTLSGPTISNARGVRVIGQVRTNDLSWSIKVKEIEVFNAAAADTQAPTVPASLTSTNKTQTSFTLNWAVSTDAVGVTGYEIFRGGTSIGTSATNSFNVTGLTANTSYSMTVRARDAVPNWSAQSTALSVTTSPIVATNIATTGVASIWSDIPSATSTSNATKSANTLINNGNTTAEVVYNDVNSAGNWQAAGIVWATAQKSITSIKFYHGIHLGGIDNGCFTANMKVQKTNDGTTWTDVSGWTVSPTYPYTAATSNQTYTLTGTKIVDARGVRVVGQVRTNDISWSIKVRELEVLGSATGVLSAPNTSILTTATAEKTSVSVYPNPASNSFNVSAQSDNAKITIIALNGKVIKSVNASTKITTFDSVNWAAGVYLIQVQTGAQTTVKKLIIVK